MSEYKQIISKNHKQIGMVSFWVPCKYLMTSNNNIDTSVCTSTKLNMSCHLKLCARSNFVNQAISHSSDGAEVREQISVAFNVHTALNINQMCLLFFSSSIEFYRNMLWEFCVAEQWRQRFLFPFSLMNLIFWFSLAVCENTHKAP